MLLLPYYSIHHDPEIYVKPDEFRPERFDDSVGGVKKYKDNCTFLTFGDGPRICLGNGNYTSILINQRLSEQFNLKTTNSI